MEIFNACDAAIKEAILVPTMPAVGFDESGVVLMMRLYNFPNSVLCFKRTGHIQNLSWYEAKTIIGIEEARVCAPLIGPFPSTHWLYRFKKQSEQKQQNTQPKVLEERKTKKEEEKEEKKEEEKEKGKEEGREKEKEDLNEKPVQQQHFLSSSLENFHIHSLFCMRLPDSMQERLNKGYHGEVSKIIERLLSSIVSISSVHYTTMVDKLILLEKLGNFELNL